jgi:hypothetical protein
MMMALHVIRKAYKEGLDQEMRGSSESTPASTDWTWMLDRYDVKRARQLNSMSSKPAALEVVF